MQNYRQPQASAAVPQRLQKFASKDAYAPSAGSIASADKSASFRASRAKSASIQAPFAVVKPAFYGSSFYEAVVQLFSSRVTQAMRKENTTRSKKSRGLCRVLSRSARPPATKRSASKPGNAGADELELSSCAAPSGSLLAGLRSQERTSGKIKRGFLQRPGGGPSAVVPPAPRLPWCVA